MKVENFHELSPVGPIVASFDVYIPSLKMTIHNVKLIKSKRGNVFPSMPSYSKTNEAGGKSYHPVISFSPEKEKEFVALLWEELKPYAGKWKEPF